MKGLAGLLSQLFMDKLCESLALWTHYFSLSQEALILSELVEFGVPVPAQWMKW